MIDDIPREAESLLAVPVDHHLQIAQAVLGGKHGRLPGGPFIALGIADQAVDAPFRLLQMAGQRRSHRHGDSLPQRAGRKIDARHGMFGMHGDAAAVAAERVEFRLAKSSP